MNSINLSLVTAELAVSPSIPSPAAEVQTTKLNTAKDADTLDALGFPAILLEELVIETVAVNNKIPLNEEILSSEDTIEPEQLPLVPVVNITNELSTDEALVTTEKLTIAENGKVFPELTRQQNQAEKQLAQQQAGLEEGQIRAKNSNEQKQILPVIGEAAAEDAIRAEQLLELINGVKNLSSNKRFVETQQSEIKPMATAVMQQLSEPQTQNPTQIVKHSTEITTTVNQPGWGQAMGERILWLSSQHVKSAEIRLDPPELGPLEVRISMNKGQATILFSAEHGAARDAVEQALPRLREMLEESGLNLANVDVSDQSLQQQFAQDSEANPFDFTETAVAASEQAETTTITNLRQTLGLVDYFA